MKIFIDCQFREVLRCKGGTFSYLCDEITEIIEKEGPKLSGSFADLMESLEITAYCGIGFDIAEFVKTEQEAKFFAGLVREAIERYEQEPYNFPLDAIPGLWIFYGELLRFREALAGFWGFMNMVKEGEGKEYVQYKFEQNVVSDVEGGSKVVCGYFTFNKVTGSLEFDNTKTDPYFLKNIDQVTDSIIRDLRGIKHYDLYYPAKFIRG